MAKSDEEKIVNLLRSNSAGDRNTGCKLLISLYKSKAVSWVKKQNGNIDPEDVWQSAALSMILAIQTGKYQISIEASLYTFFFKIIFASWYKLYNYEKNNVYINANHDIIPQEHKEYEPDIATDLVLEKEYIKNCFEKLPIDEQELLKATIYEGKKVSEVIEKFNLKNENNAKQKIFTVKRKLTHCLKTQFRDGKYK